MNVDRLIGYLFAIVVLIILIWLAIVVIDRIDEDNDPGYINPSAFVAGLE